MTRPRAIRVALVAAVVLTAVLPYLNGLGNGFTFDDVALVQENPRVRSLAGVRRGFTTDWWNGERPRSLAYRPLTMAAFAIDYAIATRGETGPRELRLAPDKALAFHVQNVFWHAAACIALFFLVLVVFESQGLAFATAVLFAAHPVHTEAVDGIVGRAELMSASLAFAALAVGWRAVRDNRPGWARPAVASILLLLALLSKESAIVIPAVPLIGAALLDREPRTGTIRSPAFRRLVAGLAFAAVAYLAIRAAVLGSAVASFPLAPGTIVVDNPIAAATGAGRWLTPVRVFGEVLRLTVYPKTLSADYSYDQIPIVRSLDLATSLCLLGLAGLAAGAVALRSRLPAASFGIAFFLLAWSLPSNIPVVIGTIFGERLLYLPSAGACLAVAGALIALYRRPNGRGVAVGWLAVVVGVGSARTWARNPDWRDNESLFAATVKTSPRSCKALDGYASELLIAGREADAVVWAERSLAVYPSYTGALETRGKSLRALADGEKDPGRRAALRREAAADARTLVELYSASAGGGDGLADAWNLVGSLALDEGDPSSALAAFEKSLAKDPEFVPSIVGSGVARSMLADREADPRRGDELKRAALDRFREALTLDPGNAEARQNEAVTLRTLAAAAEDGGRRAELLHDAEAAESQAFAARREAGDDAGAANLHGVRGKELLTEQRFAEAAAEFRESARLAPRAARAYLGLGTALSGQADHEPRQREALIGEAIRSFEEALALEPGNADAHMNLGIVYLTQRRDPAKVIEHFRAYLRLVPDSPRRAQMEGTLRQLEGPHRTTP